jgi:hypothetical protein
MIDSIKRIVYFYFLLKIKLNWYLRHVKKHFFFIIYKLDKILDTREMSYNHRSFDNDDEDDGLNSEVVWTFNNFKKEVLDAYPNGRCISEQLITIGGESTWKIDFYPNGKDGLTFKKIVVVITLIKSNDKSLLEKTEAECNFRIQNIDKRINYVGTINRQLFKSYVSAQDSSFDSKILYDDFTNQNDTNFLIGIGISQFKVKIADNEDIKFNRNVRSQVSSLEEEFQKVNVKPLY